MYLNKTMDSNINKIIQEVVNVTGFTFEQISQVYLAPFKMQKEAMEEGRIEVIDIPRVFRMSPKLSVINKEKRKQKCKNLEKNQ